MNDGKGGLGYLSLLLISLPPFSTPWLRQCYWGTGQYAPVVDYCVSSAVLHQAKSYWRAKTEQKDKGEEFHL